jgi:hypothetical protein|tara:strand:+ start:670 stop:1107 length:438 start_codon:yes stop_codon:yes gene_type:complete
MAHFAELDDNNIVKRVIVVGNDVETADGPLGENDMHVDGETWCVDLLGGNWKQTSYNNNFRKQYCSEGYTYDAAKNKFISPQRFASWALNENDDWQAPVTFPTDTSDTNKRISWNEEGQKWTAVDNSDPIQHFNWDASALAWVSA